MFDGETAFTLYDTYGFPLDLTQDALRARGISVDLASFNDAMERQRAKARASWAGSGDAAPETVWFALARENRRHRIPRLRDRKRRGRRRGAGEGRQGSRRAQERRERRGGDQPDAVLRRERRPGRRHRRDAPRRVRLDRSPIPRRRPATCSRMSSTVEEGSIKVGDPLQLDVDHARRGAIRQNHSATHLLHEALRQVLGDHVAQKGSLVAPDRLRFDFSHPKPMSAEELEQVEDIANDIVLQNCAGDDAADGARRRDAPPAPARCSARSMATRFASSRWAKAPAIRWAGRSNCAAAPMSGAPATSALFRWSERIAGSRPGCAGSRR